MELYLFDKNKEVIGIIEKEKLLNYTQKQVLNDLITAGIEGVYTDKIKQAQYVGSQDVDDRSIFWRYKIDELKTHGQTFNVEVTYELFDDLKGRKVVVDRRPQGWSAAQSLSVLLDGTGWEVGNVTTNNTASTNWYYISPLEAFWDFLDKWRVEFKPRMVFSKGKVVGKYIDIHDRLSDDYGKWYEYGDKLLTVVAEEKSNNIYTAFYGRGKGEEVGETDTGDATYGRKISFADVEWSKSAGDPLDKPLGQEWLEFPSATAEYGYENGEPRYDVVEFNDIEDPVELLQATYGYGLSEIRPKAQFSANVLEKKLAELGETVAIIRDLDDIRYKTRVFELNRDFLNKNVKQIQFGDRLLKSRATKSKEVNKQLKEQEELTMGLLDRLRKQIIDSYFNDDGYNYELKVGNEFDLPAGYYSFNAPIDQDPTKVIYVGAGKMLIANSKLPNGEWDFKTAATADGLYADRLVGINADLVRASFNAIGTSTQIEAGLINLVGSNYWRRNVLTGTGLELFNGEDAFNQAGVIGYFKSTAEETKSGEFRIKDVSSKHHIGIGVNTTHNLTFGVNPEGFTTVFEPTISITGTDNLVRFFRPITARNSMQELWVNAQVDYRNSAAVVGFTRDRNRLYFGDSKTYLEAENSIDFYAQFGSHLLTLRESIIARKNIFMDGNEITGQSDVRLKENIEDVDIDVRNEFKRMRPIEYDWKKDHPLNKSKPEGRQIGLEAQYSPFLQVKQDEESYLSISHTKQTMLNSIGIKHIYEILERRGLLDE